MNILLLGGSGILGENFREILTNKKINFQSPSSKECDISNQKSLKNFIKNCSEKFNLIINCASFTKVDLAETEQKKASKINFEGVVNLASLKIPIINFSTDYVFGNFPNFTFIEENFPRFPLNFYGGTKLRGEIVLEDSDLHFYNIRISWLIGGKNDFIGKILTKIKNGTKTIKVIDDEIGRPTFAKDLVEFVVKNFVKKIQLKGSYHLQNQGNPISWADFAKTIIREKKLNINIEKISAEDMQLPAIRPQNSILKNTKLTDNLPNWEDSLSKYLAN